MGMIPYDRLPSYLAMCDAFVTASVTEVHPLSVIEAMGSCAAEAVLVVLAMMVSILIREQRFAPFTIDPGWTTSRK